MRELTGKWRHRALVQPILGVFGEEVAPAKVLLVLQVEVKTLAHSGLGPFDVVREWQDATPQDLADLTSMRPAFFK